MKHKVLSKIVKKLDNIWKYLLYLDDAQLYYHFGENSNIDRPLIVDGKESISIGDNTHLIGGARIQIYNNGELPKEPPIIAIGDGCYIGHNITILAYDKITIGNDVLMASNILISSEDHGMNPESEVPYKWQKLQGGEVHIGDGTWIGEKVCVLKGVSIGKKCIIGAGSVVTNSIPDFCIAVGSPARIIRRYDFEAHKWV